MAGGLVHLHQTPVEQPAAEAAVAHVGRQGSGVWLQGGGIGLGLLEGCHAFLLCQKGFHRLDGLRLACNKDRTL